MEDEQFEMTLNSIPAVIENPKFQILIEKAENKIIANVLSLYSTSDSHFHELYKAVETRWDKVASFPERKRESLSYFWARQMVLDHITKQNEI